MKIIILCLVTILTTINLTAQDYTFNLVDSIRIEYDSNIFFYDSVNEDYFFSYSYSDNSIIKYNLENKTLHSELVRKGRGPGETLIINDISLGSNGTLHILDMNQAKILLKDDKFNTLSEFIIKAPLQMIGVIPIENDIYVHIPSEKLTGSIFNKVDLSTEPAKLIPLAAKDDIPDKLTRNNMGNLFENMGRYTVMNKSIYFMSKYSPSIKVYDITNNSVKEYEFDSDVQEMEQEAYITEDGSRISLPPQKADIVGENIFVHPNDENIVFINAYGRTEVRSYYRDVFYVFDISKNEIIGEIYLDIEVDNISVYGNRLYVGKKVKNDEPYTVYIYEL
jgi:hypothetical protein